MPGIATSVAVIQDGGILLTKRDDFEVWCLPGGGVEAGESLAQGAIREVREETGLEVRLEELVGVYSKLGYLNDVHSALFTATVTGGRLRMQPGETIELRYFEPDALPEEIVFGHGRRILDALGSVRGIARIQQLEANTEVAKSARELYALRDESSLSRAEFYLDLIDRLGPARDEIQVG
jgi:ADP-ribose pyrophosphatase YjhB (NUDIX family)